MKLCTYCMGSGSKWKKGRCGCDGWCHTPKECNKSGFKKCYRCHGRGVLGKISVACPTCKAPPRKPCKIEKKHWSHVNRMHGSRHTLAIKVAREKWELASRLDKIKAKEADAKKLQAEIKTLWNEVAALKDEAWPHYSSSRTSLGRRVRSTLRRSR